MTNYIYREREGMVKVVERVALPEGMTIEEAYAKGRDEWGGDNDFTFVAFANDSKDKIEVVSLDTSEIDELSDYYIWYSDENADDVSLQVPSSNFRKFLSDNKLWFWKE